MKSKIRKFWQKIPAENSGRKFRQKIPAENSGRKCQTEIHSYRRNSQETKP
ncbi:hypothetical protein [Methanosarcina sp. WWM596]|uniref:hypothetical protein n=1 Tax=Methanosarcina sp. WWM596 TaxID=1434103 RepID=UPI0012E057CC|nr:hypothetical protein [Methanosarcina sp. WWM596]